MNPLLENLYYSSPAPLQNLAVSLMGLRLHRERYGRDADARLAELLHSERLDTEAMQRLVEARFVAMARHAIRQVPHYRDWAGQEGIAPEDVQSLGDLQSFPILDKATVRSAPQRFLADHHRGKVFTMSTSGTSGTPLTVYSDVRSRREHYAFFSRLRNWFGLPGRPRRATFFGRIIMRPEIDRPPFWRYDAFQKNLLMSSYHLSPGNAPHYEARLRRYAPDEIIGYPSSLYQLARHILDNGRPPLEPRLVITTAETLLSYQRDALARAFACPVVNQYGCTEMAFFASQCEDGTMHVHPEHGVVEILDGSGAPVPAGETGELVATGVVNSAMPLIRYRLGDRARAGTRDCACGRAFPVLDALEGRVDDTLYKRDGTPVGRLDPVFKGGSGILEAQIVQHAGGDITVNVVPGPDFSDSDRDWIGHELRKRMGPGLSIDIHRVTSIPRGPGGKFRAVIHE